MKRQANSSHGAMHAMRAVALAAAVVLAMAGRSPALTTFDAARPVSSWATGDECVYNAYGFCEQDGAPAIASDGNGIVVVAWPSVVDLSGVHGSTWRLLFVRSIDGGRTWSLPAYLDAFAAPPSDDLFTPPTLVADGAGNFVAAWRAPGISSPNPGFALIRSTDGGQNWAQVTAAPGFEGFWFSSSYSEGTGTIVMTGSKSVQRSVDGGATWTDYHAFGEGDTYRSYSIANDGAGTWMLAYSLYTSPSYISVSTDDGATWSAFSTPFPAGADPVVATDGAGTWYLAAAEGGSTALPGTLYFARSTDAGASWSVPVELDAATNYYFSGQLLAHGNGRVELIMVGGVGGAAGKDIDLVAYTSYDDGDTWSRVRALTGSARISAADAPGVGGDIYPAVAKSGDSTIVAWLSYESLRFDLGEGLDVGYDPDVLFAIGTERCDEVPRSDCRTVGAEGSTSLKVKHSTGGKDSLKWSWKHGSATTIDELGDPTIDTNYTLCLYGADAAPMRLLSEQHMDTDGLCRHGDCWQPKSNGYAYGDSSGINGAVKRLSLRPGEDGDASLSAQASGPSLGFPVLPIAGLTQIRIQVVQESDGNCWDALLDQVESNTDRTLTIEGQ